MAHIESTGTLIETETETETGIGGIETTGMTGIVNETTGTGEGTATMAAMIAMTVEMIGTADHHLEGGMICLPSLLQSRWVVRGEVHRGTRRNRLRRP